MKHYLILFISISSLSFAKQNKQLPANLYQDIPGCPLNSKCDNKMGSKRLGWLQTLKKSSENTNQSVRKLEKYRQRNGILVDVWLRSLDLKDRSIIGWDSFCQNHKVKNKQLYYQGKVFLKNHNDKLLNKNKNPQILLDPIIVKIKKKVYTYWVPAKDVPYAIQNNKLLILREEEGQYFTLAISPKGTWEIQKTHSSRLTPSFKVPCPEKLILQEQKLLLPANLYQTRTCKSIKNISSKIDVVFLSKWSCS